MRRLVLLTVTMLTFSAHQGLAQDAQQAVEKNGAAWAAAFNAGDGKAVADLYTENGALYPPDSGSVDGREAIATFWQGVVDAGIKNANLQMVEVVESGDLAYEVGRLSLSVPTAEGGMVDVGGNYIVVWQRGDDGVWRLHRDIWNIDPPAE